MSPLGFPDWNSATFFSTALLEETQSVDLIELFIPSNPFESVLQTVLPGIVVFSIIFGVALIGIDEKQILLDILSSLSKALMRIIQFMAKLTPVGVFAIVGSAVGTLPLDIFSRLGVYIALHGSLCLVLALFVLPTMVAVLTPLSYKEIVLTYRTPLMTAFATGSLLIVLPLIIERSKELLQRLDSSTDNTRKTTASLSALMSVFIVFPGIGKLSALAFVPFAAWHNDLSLSLSQYLILSVTGIASFFGNVSTAIGFLLGLFNIPLDMLHLQVTLHRISESQFSSLLDSMAPLVWVCWLPAP